MGRTYSTLTTHIHSFARTQFCLLTVPACLDCNSKYDTQQNSSLQLSGTSPSCCVMYCQVRPIMQIHRYKQYPGRICADLQHTPVSSMLHLSISIPLHDIAGLNVRWENTAKLSRPVKRTK